MRAFLHEILDALRVIRAICFGLLGKVVTPAATQTSIALGVRPQHIAYVLLALSFALDVFGEIRYDSVSEAGLTLSWAFSVTIHVGVMIFAIESTRRFLKRIEDTGEIKVTQAFIMALDLSMTWVMLVFFTLGISMIAALWDLNAFYSFQMIENVLDLLSLGFTWTLMTKPPSLWSRLKDRAKDWEPTFAPMPQGV